MWIKFTARMNSIGVPMPMVRDPKTARGSVSLTLVFISSLLVIVGIVGKWSKFLGDIDIANALQFFYASSALYFGRKFQLKDGVNIEDTISENKPQDKQ